jgi:short-subunit dehydrogenase
LRVELRFSGLRVLTVCPGYIDTELTAGNPYRMPFIMNTTEAAAKIAGAIERRRGFVVIPWQMAVLTKVLRILPNAIFDRVFARAPRKPRRS